MAAVLLPNSYTLCSIVRSALCHPGVRRRYFILVVGAAAISDFIIVAYLFGFILVC